MIGNNNYKNFNQFSEYDIYLFKNGNHFRLYEKMGAHRRKIDGEEGIYFAVWAPNATDVCVAGDFNGWSENNRLVSRKDGSGIWETFIPGLKEDSLYKYKIKSGFKTGYTEKADPFSFYCEIPPKTASIVRNLEYDWKDEKWMRKRAGYNKNDAPFSIYEVHLGSWRRDSENNFLGYRQIAKELAEYVKENGYTHVELLPIMEHPFYGSWGYQITGFFAPTSRYGNPQDFMYFVDYFHQKNIGVILDWVPSHFPDDLHGLYLFDGTHLYEHADKKLGYHPDWKSRIFNYGRYEVRQFLINSALFWLDKYHIDGIRIDAVASMLYLDYSRKEGQWIPNKYGGRENLEAIEFIKQLNTEVYKNFPDVQTMAEESTAWPMVTKPVYSGGLGFGMKWNMGWMHDTLNYFSKDPVYRKYHQNELNFTFWYAFNENFVLPISHDEVVHGKKSLLGKMPGDIWKKFANLRLLLSYMFAYPGKKLIFMGTEFAQPGEWDHDSVLQWHFAEREGHRDIKRVLMDLNRIYRKEKAFYVNDFNGESFKWVDFKDHDNSIISFLRTYKNEVAILACFNFTPVPRYEYRIGVPSEGVWKELFNSDSEIYGGSGHGNFGELIAQKFPCHGYDCSIIGTLPPLGALFFKKAEKGK
ncbi:MAG TPA: 1,4-alpha-glucan branching protein GlgB [Actinobacteria bacterium]|nr:1,4-alpha-glucan branching protein GlgB [Actinomycetota bacterium]